MAKKRLNEMERGERGKVVEISSCGSLRQRIMDMGIVRGAEIEMVRRAPLGDPLEFLLRGYKLTLRRGEAANVFLEVDRPE
ncbi:MAG TPA: ferrous iron transport protein A [Methanothrix sp.]|nr:ferrous iron transport protein A [Methanothrix sp.]HPJ84012.1 ferrous iron transport protein A [Methanothrix sp.]HPR66598.1 ferrous iron transport protein A [Methanothrix sp.]